MAKKKFTDAAIKRIPTPKTGRIEYWDSLTPGFGLRITDKGRRSWVLMTRAYEPKTGKRTLARFTLGAYPAMGLGAARKAAGAKLDEVSRDIEAGIDTRANRFALPVKVKARAIEDAVTEFFRLYVNPNLRERSAEQYRIAWYVHALPRWPGRAVDDIKRSDVITLLDEIVGGSGLVEVGKTFPVTGRVKLPGLRQRVIGDAILRRDQLATICRRQALQVVVAVQFIEIDGRDHRVLAIRPITGPVVAVEEAINVGFAVCLDPFLIDDAAKAVEARIGVSAVGVNQPHIGRAVMFADDRVQAQVFVARHVVPVELQRIDLVQLAAERSVAERQHPAVGIRDG